MCLRTAGRAGASALPMEVGPPVGPSLPQALQTNRGSTENGAGNGAVSFGTEVELVDMVTTMPAGAAQCPHRPHDRRIDGLAMRT
jgi:hypothetical protein